jgi:hypothetical protein
VNGIIKVTLLGYAVLVIFIGLTVFPQITPVTQLQSQTKARKPVQDSTASGGNLNFREYATGGPIYAYGTSCSGSYSNTQDHNESHHMSRSAGSYSVSPTYVGGPFPSIGTSNSSSGGTVPVTNPQYACAEDGNEAV